MNHQSSPARFRSMDFRHFSNFKKQFSLAVFLFFVAFLQAQTTRYVMENGTGDGSAWANASGDLQSMIDASASGDEVWVAAGTYIPAAYPTGCTTCSQNRDKAFSLKDGVKVYGGFAGTEMAISERTTGHETILSGDVDNDGVWNTGNACHVVVSVLDGVGTLLDGLTITHGYGQPQNPGRNIEGKSISRYYGAGLHATSSNLSVNNVRFIENRNAYGGAFYFTNGTGVAITNSYFSSNDVTDYGSAVYDEYSTGTVVDGCTFINNSGISQNFGTYYYQSTSTEIKNCTFQDNTAYQGGAIYSYGSGMTLSDCDFIGNETEYQGGAAYFEEDVTVTRCVFLGNTGTEGGAVYVFGNVGFSDCLFANNTATGDDTDNGVGGGVYAYGHVISLTNCTIANNTSPNGAGGGIANYDGTVILQNSILWGNTDGNASPQQQQLFQTAGGTSTISYSIYQNGLPTGATDGGNNGVANPIFVAPATNDFSLQNCSPAINTGNNAVASTTDLVGNPRIFNSATVDMGAYEQQGTSTAPLTPSISNISIVNIGTCNNNGTGNGYDDTFTADVTVTFANAPADQYLNLYLNGGYVGSVASNDLACSTTYTFTGATMYANGSDLIFSADFDGNNSFTSLSLGTAPPSCTYAAVEEVLVEQTSSCDQHNTSCETDDSYTADVRVYFNFLPASGSLELSSPDILGTPPSVPVADMDGNLTYHTFTGVNFRADGESIQVSAGFSGNPTFENADAGTAPSCGLMYSDITVSGMQGACSFVFVGPLSPAAAQNGAPAWYTSSYGGKSISWSGTRWEYRGAGGSFLVAHVDGGTTGNLPCSGWVQDFTADGCGTTPPTLSGGCGILPTAPGPSVSGISLANASACNDNGTPTTAADDYFTADFTVTFAFAPATGDLTLKNGTTVLATKSAADLNCTATWTFTGVQLPADGADIVLTAEFSPAATFTSGSLGTAPVSCNCVAPTAFSVTGGGNFCTGATSAIPIGLSGSQVGVNYQFRRDGADLGDPRPGTGAAIAFSSQVTAGVYTVVATADAGGCTLAMTGGATIVAITLGLSVANISTCNGYGTTCTSDDTYTVDVVLTFSEKPASGTLSLSGPTLLGTPPSIDVSQIGANEHTFTGVTFRADGQAIDLTAIFSQGCSWTDYGSAQSPSCFSVVYQNIEVSGMEGDCGTFGNGTYASVGPGVWFNDISYLFYDQGTWVLAAGGFLPIATSTDGAPDVAPCSGWTTVYNGTGCNSIPPIVTGGCGVPPTNIGLPASITSISLANASSCNSNGTPSGTDDTFTANVTVNFAYAPGTGNLTLKRGATVVATKSAAELNCANSWTFTGISMAANGQSIVLTAEFSNTITFTSASLGTAPGPCSCALVTTFSVIDVTCFGGENGTVFATITGGTAPYSYDWSNGKHTKNINLLAAGNYTQTVTESGGCTVSNTATVDEPDALGMAVTATATTATITAFGGTPGYLYLRTGIPAVYAPNPVFTGLTPNMIYIFKTKDANGCLKSVIKKLPASAPLIPGGGQNAPTFERNSIENDQQFAVFPNPVSEILNVEFLSDEKISGQIAVVDLLGRIIFSENIEIENESVFQIPVKNFAASGYSIIFRNENGKVEAVRFVVDR